jgi:hypothetical protein
VASSWSRSVSRPRRRWSVALVAVCWLALTGAAQADTIAVTRLDDPAGPGSCPTDCSLRQAIAGSATSDTIALGGTSGSPATYTLTQGNALQITHSLTIEGAGRAATRIDGSLNRDALGRPDRILKATAGPLLIRNLTFMGGTDGRDENFTSCSPCNPLNANGGGAIFNAGASVTLSAVTFEANAGSPVGGAIANSGTLDMSDVDFRANAAAFGAGLISSGTVTAERVTFRDGSGTRGGAVFLRGGTMTLTNSTVSGNGMSSTVGGGLVNRAGNLTLLNVTLADNLRGGLETAQGATTSVQNTILASGYSDGDNGSCVSAGQNSFQGWITAAPITTDLGYNLAEDGTCGLTAPTSQSQVHPRLVPTTDNAGATPTAALLNGSPAIDAGNDSACPPYDQRSVMRSGQGTHCDIGAFEAIKLGAPSVTASSVSEFGSFDATLTATFNLAGEAGALHFLWGTSPTDLPESTELLATGLVSSPTQKTVPLYGLSPGTTYYVRAVAENATGLALGSVQQFTTDPAPPVVSNVEVISVTDTTATLAFGIDPSGAATSYVIRFDRDGGHAETAPVNIGSVTGTQELTHTLAGLEPGTDYTFDVIATNSVGSQGLDVPASFRTQRQFAQVSGSAVNLTDTGLAADCPTASIDWGDGTPADTTGTVTCNDDGHDGFEYALTAAHTYRAAGSFQIQIEYSTGEQGRARAVISAAPAEATPTPVATIQPTPTATPIATPTPPPAPTFHETVVVKPVSGTVLVKLKGTSKFVPLTAGKAVPLGSQIDVTKGRITLTSIPKAGGKPETATFYAGIFTVTQSGSITELRLTGPLATCKGKASAATKKPKTRKLWGDGKGQFRTRGQYSAATIRGTKWLVQDSCAGTLTKVASGVVSVRDTVRGKTVLLRAPRSYLAKPR